MMMARHVVVAAALGFLAVRASAAPPDCPTFLTGQWVGKGDFEAFGRTTKVDNKYSYNKDGSFETLNRFLGEGGIWQEQRVRGSWTAARGKGRTECRVTMNGKFESEGTSSTSTFDIIDANTFRSLGFDMQRVRP
jgi:hypothetical protein